MAESMQARGGPGPILSAGGGRRTVHLLAGGGLLAVAALHGAVIAAHAASRGTGESWLSVGGFVALELVLLLPVEEIRWIEGAGTYVRIHGPERSYLLRDTLESLAERLAPSGFVRVHRSAILNLRHLESLEPVARGRWTARLTGGASVWVAASRTDRLEAALGDTLDR